MNEEHISCQSHCCIVHGCKYSMKDCPVILGEVKQDYMCEQCNWEGYTTIPKTAMGYSEFLGTEMEVCGLEMTWENWMAETLMDMVENPNFSHKTLNFRDENWKEQMARNLAQINPDIISADGLIDYVEMRLTYTNLVLFQFGHAEQTHFWEKRYDRD